MELPMAAGSVSRRKSYTAHFKLEVVEAAKEKGNREAAQQFDVGESSVWEWRKAEAVLKFLHKRKRAMRFRKCLWPTVEKKLYDWVVKEREKESKRIAQEDNIEDFKAYPSWVFGFMRRNNLSVRSSTSVGQKLPSDWEAKVAKFRLYLKENLCGVDFQHFGNIDEVPVSFDMPASRSVNLKGAKEVSVTTTVHERSNFTVVLCVTACGSKLPPMVIFKRQTIPKGCESKDVIVTANQKGDEVLDK
ncbi:hypothetical protein J437_LFUL018809 [Ladona fulva]|uniref:Brinker DNA-binding domain-containing protein n=1 Tax=Ladona fulva TaxID=123851 RepID=A0A8K0PBR2_LADFU|nr:hypothetical protein J437_LFUL018809 [Ladona fulva]